MLQDHLRMLKEIISQTFLHLVGSLVICAMSQKVCLPSFIKRRVSHVVFLIDRGLLAGHLLGTQKASGSIPTSSS